MKIHKTFIGFTGMLLLTAQMVYAQQRFKFVRAEIPGMSKEELSKGLIIGDSIPDELWDLPLQVVNYGKEYIKLRDFEDKMIILDFWGRGCKPCIASVDKLNALQPEYQDELVVLPVHVLSGPDSTVLSFAQTRNWTLPVIIGENATVLNQRFYSGRGNWGVVWIKDGCLLAMPRNISVTEENILKALTDENFQIMNAENYRTYFEVVELDDQGGAIDKLPIPYTGSVFGPYKDYSNVRGDENQGLLYHAEGTTLTFRNVQVPSLIWHAYKPDFFHMVRERNLTQNLRHPLTVRYRVSPELFKRWLQPLKRTGDYEEDLAFRRWADTNLYCYQQHYPDIVEIRSAYRDMQREINQFLTAQFGVSTHIEDEQVTVWEVISNGRHRRLTTESTSRLDTLVDHYRLRNQPARVIINILQGLVSDTIRVIHDLERGHNFDLDIPRSGDVFQLREALHKAGMGLKLSKRKVPVLIVEEHGWDRSINPEHVVLKWRGILEYEIKPKEVPSYSFRKFTERRE